MRNRLLLTLLLTLPSVSQADDSGRIAALCKQQWPGHKGMQSFCIKEKRNYRDWLKYTRKRIYSHKPTLLKLDGCQNKFKPDYRKAFDCYWSS